MRRAASAIVACALASTASAGDASGRAILSYDDARLSDLRSRGFSQRYELAYDHSIFPRALDYRLELRFTTTDSRQSLVTADSVTKARELQPRLQLRSQLPGFSAIGSYDVAYTRSVADPGDIARRLVQRLYGSADAALPLALKARLYGTHQVTTDVDTGAATRSSVADVGLSQRVEPFGWNAGASWRGAANNTTDATQNNWAPRAGLQYEQASRGGRATLGAGYSVLYDRSELSVAADRPVEQAVPVVANRAFHGENPLPGDDSGRPLSPFPVLTDGDVETPSGIALGLPDGHSFQNLAIDLGRIGTVDELRVVVRGAPGLLVPFGAAVSWSAYASADGIRWDPVPGASSAFDPTLSLFAIRFQPVVARHFKVVSLGINDVPTFVTEVEAYEHRLVERGRTLVEGSFAQNARLRGSVRPHEKVTLSTEGSVNHAVAGLHRAGDPTERADWQGGGGVAFGPYGLATYSAQHHRTGVLIAAGPRARSDATSAGVSWQLLPTLEAHAGAQLGHEEIGDVRSRSIGGTAGASAVPSSFAFFRFDVGAGQQTVEPADTESIYVNANGSAGLTLTRALQVQLLAIVQTGRIRLPSPSGFSAISQTSNSQSYQAMVAWSPSATLQLSANVMYVRTESGEGPLQAYRVYWYPFPGGAFAMTLSLDQSFDALTGARSTRLSAMPRWVLNRHVAIEGSYGVLGTDEIRFGEHQQFNVALNVSF
ncbi:MAG TPA: hypothetical protein VD838_00890 [Anaeromyxobacteraceae bacterium]|nr:hypothetical protein [Anaeromyxobacteraceae bacterium]